MVPKWFILTDPPDVDISLEKWQELGYHRARMLESIATGTNEAIADSISRASRTPIGKLSYQDSFKGHLLLRLAASTSKKLKSWLVETEGDVFDYEFLHEHDLGMKRAVLKEIFGYKHVKTIADLVQKEDIKFGSDLEKAYQGSDRGKEFIAVYFSQVEKMLSWRRMIEIHKGWLIARPHEFRGDLKRKFEKKLETVIDEACDLIEEDSEVEKLVLSFANQLEEHVQLRSKFSMPELEGKILHAKLDLVPPCMRLLTSSLEKTGYLTHFERLQLGIFLKRVGMTVDEQMHFWYSKSVDNVGLDFEIFVRKRGYQIKHLYGLIGGGIDYGVPKCRTIARGYFCPFTHLSPEELSQILEDGLPGSQPIDEREINKIMNAYLDHKQGYACGRLFSAIYRREGPKWINHPLQWVKNALEKEKEFANT